MELLKGKGSTTLSKEARETGCRPKATLEERPLLSGVILSDLESTFKMLASGTRLRLLHALVREGELCVGELGTELDMTPQAVSNQLQRLADKGIVETRRDGLQIYYRIIDPCVVTLLERGWCLTEEAQARVLRESIQAQREQLVG